MRRWNGWGDEGIHYSLPEGARRMLESLLGPGEPPQDAALRDVVETIPPTRLPSHALVSAEPDVRARHARGQSLPDWIALRSGRLGVAPDGVAFPGTAEEVRGVLRWAREAGAHVIPYGGGTSVVGHVNPQGGTAPVLTLSLARMTRLVGVDVASQLATFEAGVTGPDLEAALRARGLTLGHYPQSFELSTLGGWIATRSSGQQSLGYGRIERLFAGGRLEAPAGTLGLPPLPASAAGPDLKELVLGSEGRLGVITEATVRATSLPEQEEFHGLFLPSWDDGLAACRAILQARLPVSMARLSNAAETETSLALAEPGWRLQALDVLLGLRGLGPERCLLVLGFTGSRGLVKATRAEAFALARSAGAVVVGQSLGRAWKKNRFRAPYLRNSLWEAGYAVDTLETAAPWSRLPALARDVEEALRGDPDGTGGRTHVFTHLSHAYLDGASLYTTYLFRLPRDPDEALERWRRLKAAASRAIVAREATISHQHGVGTDHRAYLEAEKGPLGLAALEAACRVFDPEGFMNPGKLVG